MRSFNSKVWLKELRESFIEEVIELTFEKKEWINQEKRIKWVSEEVI